MRQVLGVLALLALGTWVGATSYPRQPTMNDLAKIWIGGNPGSVYDLYRLELDKEGKGLLISTSGAKDGTAAYRIIKTTLSRYTVEFVLVRISSGERPGDKPPSLRGQALASSMNLVLRGSDWKTTLMLQDEADLASKLKAVAERAAAERGR